MKFEQEINWQYLYKHSYRNQVEKFCKYIADIKDSYSDLPQETQLLITRKYLKIFKETLKIFEVFFANNCYFISEDRLIVIYILSCNILQDGMLFYKLYTALKKIEKKEQCIKNLYLKNKFINIFREIEQFFDERLKIESSYDL